MGKTVFSNAMVAHVWAQQTQEEGRSNNGNFWFQGDTIYSYRTPIARLMEVEGAQVALVSSISYSITTSSKHLNPIYRAIKAAYSFKVPTLAREREGRADKLDHAANLAYLMEEYTKEIARLKRARDDVSQWAQERLTTLWRTPFDYARVFLLPLPDRISVKQALNEIAAAHEARNTPEAKAKRAKDAAARAAKAEKKAALLRAEFAVQIKAWQAGTLNLRDIKGAAFVYGASVYLRVKGDALETSMGATVPLAHAIKAFRFVKLCKDAGRSWERNGHTLHVGHFTVDSVAPDGTMRAGCHTISWPQIEEAAKAAGVWDATPSDAALEVTP